MIAQIIIEAAQDLLAAIDQYSLDAKVVEDAGELDRDITAPDDADALRQLLQVESLVRSDGELAPRQMQRHERCRARGDEDVPGGDAAAIREGKGVPVRECGAP